MQLAFLYCYIRHDTRRIQRAEIPARSARRIANAQKAVQRELDSVPLFPELARFSSAEERLDQQERMELDRQRRIRSFEAECWFKLHRRLRQLSAVRRKRFLDYWNGSSMIPAEGSHACDTLFQMFPRPDWYREDCTRSPDWRTPFALQMIDEAFERHFGAKFRAEFPEEVA